MLNEMYTISFVMSLILFMILFIKFRKRLSNYYILLYGAVMISNFGYMVLADALSLQMAVLSNQIVYLGSSFSPFLMLMCLMDICKVKVKKWVPIVYIGVGAIIFTLVTLSGDSFGLYYKSFDFARDQGVTYLVKTYGPLHSSYFVYISSVVVFGLVSIISAFRRRKDVSFRSCILLLVIQTIMVSVYAVEKILRLKLEIMPMAYVLLEILLLYELRRISLYDVTAISSESMVNSEMYGFVLFDSKERYLGADIAAKKWFPEISNLPLDITIHGKDSILFTQMDQWIHDESANESVIFELNDLFIEAKHVVLRGRRENGIHCVYLRDDTLMQNHKRAVENYNERLEQDVELKTEKIRRIQDDIIISMASIVENRDSNTGGHIKRTSDVVKIFVTHLQKTGRFQELDKHTVRRIIKAAPLHDFGKIAVPDSILNKPGKFTDEEYLEMQKHPAKGAVIVERILQSSEDLLFKKIAVNVAHFHHEKWNGTGYPNHISGEEIPFEARVMALADVFDALVSKRVYKEQFSYDKAFSIIEDSCGTHFDPVLCTEFLKCRKELENLYDSYVD